MIPEWRNIPRHLRINWPGKTEGELIKEELGNNSWEDRINWKKWWPVIQMLREKGLSYVEIAEETGINRRTINNRVLRERKRYVQRQELLSGDSGKGREQAAAG